MKKILTVVLLCTALCAAVFAQNASDFTVNAEGVITKYGGFDTVVVIPAVIGGKNITGIGKEAFLRADLTKVTIPEGVLNIGEAAFAGNKLTSITIPSSVKLIYGYAFKDNTALAKIVILEGVKEIYSEAFANTKCTSISLPSTITYISYDAFDLSAKPSFTLAANIPTDFGGIPAFYSYIANDSKAGTYAFNLPLVKKEANDFEYYETRYGAVLRSYKGVSTRVRIPATISGVAVKALYGWFDWEDFTEIFKNKKLAAVQIPEGITYIGPYAFKGNELTNVTIPKSVTFIGYGAFFYCKSLTSVTIGNSVTFIGGGAFNYCDSLTSVTFEGTISSDNLSEWAFGSHEDYSGYIGDLREKYLAGGIGTYTRKDGSYTWSKQ